LGDNIALTRTVFGQKIYVSTLDQGIAPHLLLDGMWEEWISIHLSGHLRKSVFFDVGANFGWYSMLAHEQEAAQSIAFEPNPMVFDLLCKTIKVNGAAVEAHEKAVGDSNEQQELWVSEEWLGSATCLLPHFESHRKHRVDQVKLDDVYQELLVRKPKLAGFPIVIKIDVEGWEPRAVLGASSILRGPRATVFVEYHEDPKGETRLSEMLDLFESLGYQMSHVHSSQGLVPITRDKLDGLRDAEMLAFFNF